MFTHNPGDTTGIERAVGLTAAGDELRLSPELSGGTVEVIHAAQTLTNAVRRGEAAELCAEIAGRVAGSDLVEVVEVVVATDRFEIVDGLRSDDPQPVDRVVHARCEVPTVTAVATRRTRATRDRTLGGPLAWLMEPAPARRLERRARSSPCCTR